MELISSKEAGAWMAWVISCGCLKFIFGSFGKVINRLDWNETYLPKSSMHPNDENC